jgi:hypothetical protein
MTRRELIKVGLAGAVAAGLLAIGFAPRPRFIVRSQIRDRLAPWTISDAHLHAFLDAFESDYGTPAPDRDDFLQILVLSTDAFAPDRAGQTLAFTKLYHPYKAPCHNPLARS